MLIVEQDGQKPRTWLSGLVDLAANEMGIWILLSFVEETSSPPMPSPTTRPVALQYDSGQL